ncbi:unnamed protein product [Rotaria sp. Silwood2]|nr:unnamed protein product [Rotaria sp. Silwood2]
MLGDRFRCLNGSCLSANYICNGFNDCEGETDEQVCFWNYSFNRTSSTCPYPNFQCLNGKCVVSSKCRRRESCSHNEHLFWCPELNTYREGKKISSNYWDFCIDLKIDTIINNNDLRTKSLSLASSNQRGSQVRCNHGLLIHVNNPNIENTVCFCPPNHYGDRCQYFSRGIPLRLSFDRLHRTNLAQVLNIYVFLVCDQSRAVDYAQFIDSIQNLNTKHHRYLLYPHPKLQCNYSVRIEAFQISALSVQLVAVWTYSIIFDFLPSQ